MLYVIKTVRNNKEYYLAHPAKSPSSKASRFDCSKREWTTNLDHAAWFSTKGAAEYHAAMVNAKRFVIIARQG